MFFHPTIQRNLNLFLRFLLVLFSTLRDFAFMKRFRKDIRVEAHDDYLFQTLRFGDSTRCFFSSVVSFLCKAKENWVKKTNEIMKNNKNVHIRNEIMIQSEAQTREPYNNEITLCVIPRFESVPKWDRLKDNDTPILLHRHQLFLKFFFTALIRLIPRADFFLRPAWACHMPSDFWREAKRMKNVFNVRGCSRSKTHDFISQRGTNLGSSWKLSC